MLSDQDVPGVLPAQGPELWRGQRGLPVGQGAEGAVHKVHRGEPGHNQGTQHALEQHRSGMREGKSTQVTSRQMVRVWRLLENHCFPYSSLFRKGKGAPSKRTILLKPNTCRDDHPDAAVPQESGESGM